MKNALVGVVATLLMGLAAAAAFAWSGIYDVAADSPHWDATRKLIEASRDRSIGRRAPESGVPPLDDAARIRAGAEHYGEMCAQCHVAPGEEPSELRRGLNPQPPDLTRQAVEPGRAFWVIKHGVKMTGMPAWGATHDDDAIWAIVAFVRKLPSLSLAEYRALTGKESAANEDNEGGTAGHGHKDGHSHQHASGDHS